MTGAQLTIAYKGKESALDVRDLAPALLAFASLLELANKTLNTNKTEASVRVKAGFRRGSFTFDLLVNLREIEGLLASYDLTSAKELITLLLGGEGLLGLLKWLKGRKPKGVEDQHDGTVQVINQDNAKTTVNQYVYNIFYMSPDMRRSIYSTAKPLEREGIESVEFRLKKKLVQRVTRKDLPFLAVNDTEDEILEQSERKATLRLVAPVFKEDNKWRFSEGEHDFFASMDDRGFLDKVRERSEVFSDGDILDVILRTVVKRTPEGETKLEHSVVGVLDHRHGPRQLNL